ncbi:PREDICTED: E3 ubiquitin-protein ligase complex slx8-rfp subunit slx8-like isoform X2 [Nelumbo nucifera]|uniref:RING-type domain-containing protein n=2 Tax=Nelumbo nucifera TaxID=4432 RepID=A0A822YE09_NELNU|nr:PREDICTED: E3 ubiquitin-protein ligase complex slx8-rfp subunit slx8-like isoform X2 [Nelumbo nucifera]DAD30383.1 TPA_asm: hypothetical protein HUJ06_009234 [Nelumbo nucifera]
MMSLRSKRKSNQDPQLQLEHSFLPRVGMFTRNCGSSLPNIINIDDEDDDDDLLIYSPSQVSSASQVNTMGLFPIPSSRVTVTEDDLELRLGFRVHSESAENRSHTVNGVGEPPRPWKVVKTKFGVPSSSRQHVQEVDEIKLRCTICMDTMKEETSTLCGHLFCMSCITTAIRVQNRCPTCRKELFIGNIHRIYLPGSQS